MLCMADLDKRVLENVLGVCIEAIKGDAYVSSQACRFGFCAIMIF